MPHSIILFPSLPDEDYLTPFVAPGQLRFAAHLEGVPWRAVGFASAETQEELIHTRSLVCPGDPGCLDGLFYPLPRVPSVYEPGEFNLFSFVTLPPGTKRLFRDHVLGHRCLPTGIQHASALVVGLPGVDAVVEVVGDNYRHVIDAMLDLTDVTFASEVRTAVVRRGSAQGWASELANLD